MKTIFKPLAVVGEPYTVAWSRGMFSSGRNLTLGSSWSHSWQIDFWISGSFGEK